MKVIFKGRSAGVEGLLAASEGGKLGGEGTIFPGAVWCKSEVFAMGFPSKGEEHSKPPGNKGKGWR